MMLLLSSFSAAASPISQLDQSLGVSTVTETVYTTVTFTATSYVVATTTTRTLHPVSISAPSSPLPTNTVYVTESHTYISTIPWRTKTATTVLVSFTTETTTVTVSTTVTRDVAATTEAAVVVPSTSSGPPVTTVTMHHSRSVTMYVQPTTTTDTLTPASTAPSSRS